MNTFGKVVSAPFKFVSLVYVNAAIYLGVASLALLLLAGLVVAILWGLAVVALMMIGWIVAFPIRMLDPSYKAKKVADAIDAVASKLNKA